VCEGGRAQQEDEGEELLLGESPQAVQIDRAAV